MILLLFIAAPFVGYMFLANDPFGKVISYILPSCIGFDALIAVMKGEKMRVIYYLLCLLLYGGVISIVYLLVKKYVFRRKIAY